MLEAPSYSATGAKRAGKVTLPAEVFDGTVNEPVLHQAVRAWLNNQRQGTAATKTRSFISGGNQKPWKQKGTGRARQGSIRAPHWRGGGTVFGPQPRDYTTDVPRKVKQLARRSALNARAREERLFVVEQVSFTEPKTRQLVDLLAKLGLEGQKVVVLTNGLNRNAWLSSRNLQRVQVLPWAEASAYHLVWSDALVVEEGALTGAEPDAAADAASGRESRVASRGTRTTKAKKAARAAKKPVKKAAAKKTAAKKPAKKAAPKKKKGK